MPDAFSQKRLVAAIAWANSADQERDDSNLISTTKGVTGFSKKQQQKSYRCSVEGCWLRLPQRYKKCADLLLMELS
jgi:hypothetical protein